MSSPNNGVIYAIFDTVADQIVGGLQLHRHDAVAIRTFGDIASRQGTVVNMHLTDHALYRLGVLDLENEVQPEAKSLVITGAQWLASQNASQDGGQ